MIFDLKKAFLNNQNPENGLMTIKEAYMTFSLDESYEENKNLVYKKFSKSCIKKAVEDIYVGKGSKHLANYFSKENDNNSAFIVGHKNVTYIISYVYKQKYLKLLLGLHFIGLQGSILRKISCCTWGNKNLFFRRPSKVQVVLNKSDSNSYNKYFSVFYSFFHLKFQSNRL